MYTNLAAGTGRQLLAQPDASPQPRFAYTQGRRHVQPESRYANAQQPAAANISDSRWGRALNLARDGGSTQQGRTPSQDVTYEFGRSYELGAVGSISMGNRGTEHNSRIDAGPVRKIPLPPGARPINRANPQAVRADAIADTVSAANAVVGDTSVGEAAHSTDGPDLFAPPTNRAHASQNRLDARDRWNTFEIHIQEIFMQYDKDQSGALDPQEFAELLRDFNEGKPPTKEEFGFMMRIADKDGNGHINLGELHYAIRAWHSYNTVDEKILRLFALFEIDASGRLRASDLRGLLTRINGDIPVTWQEVQHVMVMADALGQGPVSRSALLGAIAAWYGQVDRKDTDVPSLLREAMARAVQDHDYIELLASGARNYDRAKALATGEVEVGYGPVQDSQNPDRITHFDRIGEGAQLLQREDVRNRLGDVRISSQRLLPATEASMPANLLPANENPMRSTGVVQKAHEAAPFFVRSCATFCYVAFPFLFNSLMISIGWSHQGNECPRNLDGILTWFGILGLVLTATMYVDSEHYNAVLAKTRVALVVILAGLDLVGYLWSQDVDVLGNKSLCGHLLVYWSVFIWVAIPCVSVAGSLYYVAAHYRRLQKHDEFLQTQAAMPDVIVM